MTAFAQSRVKIVSGRKTMEVVAIEFSHLISLEKSRYWIQQRIRCMTPYIPCSRGRHVPVPYIWIAYAGEGAHTCEEPIALFRTFAREAEYARKRPRTNSQCRYVALPFLSPPRRGGVLYIVCYWICLKLFKFKRRRMFFVVCNSSKRAATPVIIDNYKQTYVCYVYLFILLYYSNINSFKYDVK